MRIAFLTDQIYLHGGVERVLATKANFLAENYHHQIFVITTEQKSHSHCYPFSNKVVFKDIGVNYIRDKSYFHPHNLLKSFKHYFRIKKAFKEIMPDIVVSCNYSFDFYFLPFIFTEIPKIKEFHSSRYLEFFSKKPKRFKEKFISFLSRKAERKYDQLVVLNSDEKKFYHNSRITVIPNPIPLIDVKVRLEQKRILAAGRISPVKNFGELIDIFNELKCELKEWELHFYGEDYLNTKDELQQKINNYQLQAQVKFCGTTDNLTEKMIDYSIYAMTSETECFPMVLLESMSVGLPIISYNCPTGPKFIVKDSVSGFLASNKEEFKIKLLQLSQDLECRKRFSNGAKMNVKKFSEEKVMECWNKLLINLKGV